MREVGLGLLEVAVEILVRRLGIHSREAAIDLERALRVDRVREVHEPAHQPRLVEARVERERAIALGLRTLELVLREEVLREVQAGVGRLPVVCEVPRTSGERKNRQQSNDITPHVADPTSNV